MKTNKILIQLGRGGKKNVTTDLHHLPLGWKKICSQSFESSLEFISMIGNKMLHIYRYMTDLYG